MLLQKTRRLTNMKYTLITGASSGIGKEMAKVCASLGQNILFVSLANEKVADLANHIAKTFNVKTDYFEGDLTKLETTKNIFDWTKGNNYDVNFLVNNAGIGNIGSFESYTFQSINMMIDLNIRATTNLTHYFIPELKKNAPSYMLNSASMFANFPVPYKTIYAASKGYIRNFTRALREEMTEFDVHLSVLQPGATPTTALVKSQIEKGGFFGKISVSTVEDVARAGIMGTLNKKPIITPGFKNRVSLAGVNLFPQALFQKLLANKTRKMH